MNQFELGLLKENDFCVGKYLIALNACDDQNVNYFVYYDEELKKEKVWLSKLEKELKTFDSSDNFKREEIVRKRIITLDKETQEFINAERKIVAGLSKVVYDLTVVESRPEHFATTSFNTQILEEVGGHNEKIAELEEILIGDTFNISKQAVEYRNELIKMTDDAEKACVTLAKQSKVMKERKIWLSKTFNIATKELEKIIKKYATEVIEA